MLADIKIGSTIAKNNLILCMIAIGETLDRLLQIDPAYIDRVILQDVASYKMSLPGPNLPALAARNTSGVEGKAAVPPSDGIVSE
jgi:hypothetical protein